jgi:hypothetical protein
MRARVIGIAVASVGVATAVALSPLAGVAFAGHTNQLLSADLSGGEEVGKKGDPNGTGEVFVFGVDGDPKTLCYMLTVNKIALAKEGMAAHIHSGVKGKNGPVVVNLAGPGDGNAADCLTEGEVLASGADALPTGMTVKKILDNPKRFYVNVHNPKYPDGALRGQLARER